MENFSLGEIPLA